MNNRELLIGTILTYIIQAVHILLGLFYTPFLLNSLGQSEYGLYSTVSATISMISLLSLGLGNGYIKYYVKYDKQGDLESKYKLNGLFLSLFLLLGIAALIIGLIISNNLSWIFKEGFTQEEYQIAKKLAIILTLKVAISLPSTVFNAIIIAHERFIFSKLVSLFSLIIAPVVTIPLLLSGYKSVALVVVSLLISVLADIGIIFYVLGIMHERFKFSDFEKGLFKGLIIYTWPIALNMLIDQINLNIDKLLLGRYKGTAEVAVYNLGFTLYSMYMSISLGVSSVFVPRIHTIVIRYENDKESLKFELTSLFIRVGRIQAEILLLILTGLILFGMPFITEFWADTSYENSYYVALLLALPATIPLIQNLGIEIQRAENLHQFRSIIYGIMAIVNLALSIYLCQKYGAVGSAIGTAISYIVCNGIVMNIFYHKKCSIDIIRFWKSTVRIFLSAIPPIVIWFIIRRYFDLTVLRTFILGVIVYSVLYFISLWIFGLNEEEKEMLTSWIRHTGLKR